MKIAVISDLHFDRNNKRMGQNFDYAAILGQILKERQVDLLLLAGDLSNDYRKSQDFLKVLADLTAIPIRFVAGNHEFWQEAESSVQAPEILDYFLQQEENLINRPYILNDDWAVCGSAGWYDYGYGDFERFNLSDFERKKYRWAEWNDRRYVRWRQSDRQVSQWMKEQLQADLESVGDRKVILMTHVVNHPRFVVPLPHRLYDYINAYLGAKSYESLWQDYPVKYNIMGHVHWRQVLTERGVHHIMACLGNRRKWLNPTDPFTEIENSLMSFRI